MVVSGTANDPWIDNSEHILLARLGRAKYKSETWRWNGIPAFVATRENAASASWAFLVPRSVARSAYTLSLSFSWSHGGRFSWRKWRENSVHFVKIGFLRSEKCVREKLWELVECCCFMIGEWIISVIKTVDFSSVSSIVINREWRNLEIEIVSCYLIILTDFFDNTYDTLIPCKLNNFIRSNFHDR